MNGIFMHGRFAWKICMEFYLENLHGKFVWKIYLEFLKMEFICGVTSRPQQFLIFKNKEK
jgi:hypothetical protein